MSRADRKHIYVLKLEDGNGYVGVSKQPQERIEAHACGRGYYWTRWHRPQRVLSVSKAVPDYFVVENAVTVILAAIIGNENVVGGRYNSPGRNHGMPPRIRGDDPVGWEFFGDQPGVSITEFLGLDEELAYEWGVPLV